MVSHKLVPYIIRVNERHKPGVEINEAEYFDLTSFNMAMPVQCPYLTFGELIEEAFKEIQKELYIDDEFGRTLTAMDWSRDESNNELEAVLSKGNFGEPGDHLDTIKARQQGNSTGDAREHDALDKDTALEKRYHFLYKVCDNNPRKALLVLHARGRGGVKTDFKRKMTQKLSEIGGDVIFKMNTVVGGDLYEELLNNPITAFEVLETQVNAEQYLQESNDLGEPPEKSRVTVNLSAGKDSSFKINKGKLRDIVDNKKIPMAEFLPSSDGTGTESHKVEIEKNGRSRKLNISKGQPNMEQSITTDIGYKQDGRPKMASVSEESRRFAAEVLKEHGLGSINTNKSLIKHLQLP